MGNKVIWKIVPSFSNYAVSNLGEIKSLNYRNKNIEKILPQHKDTYGYMRATINRKNIQVHRIVAEAFLHNFDKRLQVNHIDGNKKNNNVSNLEMCTNKENSQHRTSILKKGNIKPVAMINKTTNEIIKIFNSTREAERTTKIQHSTISKVCLGKKKTAGGYKWKHLEA